MSQKYNILDNMGPIIPGENQTLHSTVRTLYQRSSMVVVVLWREITFSHRGIVCCISLLVK